jgi:virginiamycin B lyase
MSKETREIGRNWLASAARRISALAFIGTALAGALQAQSFTEYPISGDGAGIAAGPDGNIWFTEDNAGKIGRITLSGVVTEFSIPTAGSEPQSIARGPDGNLWFTENGAGKIGRITPAGTVTEFSLSNSSSTPSSIVSGSDGNLWFTEFAAGKIGRITTSGTITEFQTPSDPAFIAPGSDGNLWFTERLGNHVDRITTSGAITQFPTLTMSRLVAITAGADGNLWFISDSDNKIGRITTAGAVSEFNFPSTARGEALAAGPDGNIWSTGDHEIARITTSGVVTEFPIPGSGGGVFGIVTGADGALWFAESDNKIGRFSSGLCTSSASSLCLNNGRFQVRASWSVPAQGTSGQGTAVQLTSDTGYFWFFSSSNVEMVVKALNGCGFNSRYWVFAGGLTNVAVTLTVTDMSTGASKTYLNPANTAFLPIQDTSAFSTCP